MNAPPLAAAGAEALARAAAFPRARLLSGPTPLERLPRLSDSLGVDLWIKRDDLAGLGFGGNKVRQLEYYLGAAAAAEADTVLITGAVQSNFVRAAAAGAAKLGMKAVLQLEKRVPGMGPAYASSGNVLLARILGAEHMSYPEGEDEQGADRALRARADALRAEGRRPYVIPLAAGNPPLGALGYMDAAGEILAQDPGFDAMVVASGSGLTHAGLLAGLRARGSSAVVHGVCVRRPPEAQTPRMAGVLDALAAMLGTAPFVAQADILIEGAALAPGYGRVGARVREALELMARSEGVFLDPVYSAKTFAGALHLIRTGAIGPGARVLLAHTGGLPGLFAYEDVLVD